MIIYKLPDLSSSPQRRVSYVINNKQLSFVFWWLGNSCLLSVYTIRDGQKVYLLQNISIAPNVDLFARINNYNIITGSLYIKNKNDVDTEITQDNFHTDFEMEYYDE